MTWDFTSFSQSSGKSVRVYKTDAHKMITMYLIIQDDFTRLNEFSTDMSGGQTEFREDCFQQYFNRWVIMKGCVQYNPVYD